MMPLNITYLLGAGASFNALPIYSNMALRIEIFLAALEDKFGNEGMKLDIYKSIIKDIKFFGSPDSLARKYFLSDAKNKEQNIESLKNLLSCFFVIEQISIMDGAFNAYINDRASTKKELINSIQATIDTRYISFFATILGKASTGGLALPNNVKIVSWNYDMQIERAFQEFAESNFKNAQRELAVFPRLEVKGFKPTFDANKFGLIKLNGTANFKFASSSNEVFDPKHLQLNSLELEKINKILRKEQREYNLMHFAWDDEDDELREARSYAKSIFELTDILVIIGYSFPDFNRSIDRDIFSKLKKSARIYIQDPAVGFIVQKLNGVKADLKSCVKESVTELKNFVIPYEFWE